jgi:hypothetical protein
MPEEPAPAFVEGSIPTVEAEPVTLDGLELELNELPDLPLPGVGSDSAAPTIGQEPVELERAAEDALPLVEPVEAVPEVPVEAPLPSEAAPMPDAGVGAGMDPPAPDLAAEPAEEGPSPTEEMVVAETPSATEGPELIMPEGLEPTALFDPPVPSAPAAPPAPSPAAAEAAWDAAGTEAAEPEVPDEPVWIEPQTAPPAEEPAPAAEHPPQVEPEPVVTETMAEVYAKQGLLENALEVYRQLVAANPGDEGLASRMAELEGQVMAAQQEKGAAAPARSYSAKETGGTSARDYLADVLASRPAAVSVQEGAAPSPAPAPAPAQAAASQQPAEEPAQTGPAQEGGISFDEFFGGERPGTPQSAEPSGPDEPEKSGGGDDFKTWLEGLKS